MSGKDLAKALEKAGWVLLRIQGSHHIYGKPDSSARSLKVGLLRHLLKMSEQPDD